MWESEITEIPDKQKQSTANANQFPNQKFNSNLESSQIHLGKLEKITEHFLFMSQILGEKSTNNLASFRTIIWGNQETFFSVYK